MEITSAVSDRRSFLRRSSGLVVLGALAAGCRSQPGLVGSGEPQLTQWYHDYGQPAAERAAKRYAAAFGKARVTVRWKPGNYTATLAAALLGPAPPDIFEGQVSDDLVRSGQLVPLDDLLGAARPDFAPADLAANTVNGKVYGIPMVEDMQLLYYRKSLLQRAGLPPPATVEELIGAAKALTTKKVKGLFVGNDGGVGALGGPVLWSAGLTYTTPEHRMGFDSPRAVAALEKLRQLYTSNSLLLDSSTDWSDPSAFVHGLVAMQWTGLSALPAITRVWGGDVAVAAFPPLDGQGRPSVPITTFAAMVDAKSPNLDAAKAFVRWLWVDRTDYQAEFALDYGLHLPARTSVAEKATALASGPRAEALPLSRRYAMPATPPDWTPKMGAAYADALTNVIRGGAKPGPQLDKVKATVTSELARLFG